MYGFMKPQGLKCLKVNLSSINPFKPTSEISNPAEKRQNESSNPRRLSDVLNAFDKEVLDFFVWVYEATRSKVFRSKSSIHKPFQTQPRNIKPSREVLNRIEKTTTFK